MAEKFLLGKICPKFIHEFHGENSKRLNKRVLDRVTRHKTRGEEELFSFETFSFTQLIIHNFTKHESPFKP